MRSKKNCFNCKIIQNGNELLNQDFFKFFPKIEITRLNRDE